MKKKICFVFSISLLLNAINQVNNTLNIQHSFEVTYYTCDFSLTLLITFQTQNKIKSSFSFSRLRRSSEDSFTAATKKVRLNACRRLCTGFYRDSYEPAKTTSVKATRNLRETLDDQRIFSCEKVT